jgi:hypothetical protein
MPVKRHYSIGDECWIAVGEPALTRAKVVHAFVHDGVTQYVVEYETHVDPVLMVRDWLTMSETSDGPLGYWAKIRENRQVEAGASPAEEEPRA